MKPFIVIGCFLLWLVSCKPSSIIDPSVEQPVEKPVEEGTPLLFEPNDTATIKVANEFFMVDFSLSDVLQPWYDWPGSGWIHNCNYLSYYYPTKEAVIERYKNKKDIQSGATNSARDSECEYIQLEYTLAQECFSDNCTSELRKEILKLVIDRQILKNKYPGSYACAIHTGVLLMAVIILKEREYSTRFIDFETLQKALLFLNDFHYFNNESIMYYGRDFSELIVNCAQNFLSEFNKQQ